MATVRRTGWRKHTLRAEEKKRKTRWRFASALPKLCTQYSVRKTAVNNLCALLYWLINTCIAPAEPRLEPPVLCSYWLINTFTDQQNRA
ncbi:unnamed protein product [Boreogadus saida]